MPTIDPYSAAAIPLQMFFNDTELGIGTGFIWHANNQNFLITNWHNFTGKNPFTGKHLSPTAAEPNAVRIWWNTKSKLGEKFAARHTIYDPSGVPIWLIHPTLGKGVDVIALPLEEKPDADMFPINELDQLPQMAWKIGMDAHVLGYPYGIGEGNGGFPIWKRASIASEPEMITDARKHFLLDTASRPGMSGAPIILRAWNAVLVESGNSLSGGVYTRFIGVYAGRIAAKDPLEAQLGLGWHAHYVSEIVAGGLRDHKE